jgi:hypothetical protein
LTCVEAALVCGVVKLVSGIYSKLIKVIVLKKVKGEIFEV